MKNQKQFCEDTNLKIKHITYLCYDLLVVCFEAREF